MRRSLWLVPLLLTACSSEPTPRRVDGGAFELPDGGFRDVSIRDAGFDGGSPPCMPPCGADEACGCLELPAGRSCGCHPRGAYDAVCDPTVPETCRADLRCVAARNGQTTYFCSDGRLDSFCSKRNDPDVCTTQLGCVCLTSPAGTTVCTCRDEADPDNPLCDPMVPETCTEGTCIRATGPAGVVYFACSDGSEGQPCEVGDTSCRTTLGCTCPIIGGLARCRCSEPAGEGGPCDLSVPEACEGDLFCVRQRDPNGDKSVCTAGLPDAGTGGELPCNPLDPFPCPPGLVCLPTLMGYTCQPG